MARTATIRWAKQYVGTHTSGVKAGNKDVVKIYNKAKEQDGAIEDVALKNALRGKPRGLWSAVMGAYASAIGDIHHSPTREQLLNHLARNEKKVLDADEDGSKRYSLAELRTLKSRGQQHQIEYAKVRKQK